LIPKKLKKISRADFIAKQFPLQILLKQIIVVGLQEVCKKKSTSNFGVCKLQSLHIDDFPKADRGGPNLP
jgi:hypothetical protein